MKTYPAIALIEFSSIATGISAANEMLKKAPIAVIKSGTVHNGKYIVLIGGSVASVEESYQVGIDIGGDTIIDNMVLPDVHQQLHDAILGSRLKCNFESLAILEASSIATMIKVVDAGIKGANVDIVEIRLADDLGGKSFTLLNGSVEDVQAAVEIVKNNIGSMDNWINDIIISNIHTDMRQNIESTTKFALSKLEKLEGSEV